MQTSTSWRSFRMAAGLGWVIESNWTDPFLFAVYSIVKPVSGAAILVIMYGIISQGNFDSAMFPYIYLGTAFYIYVAAVMTGVSWAVVDDREHYKTLKYMYIAPIYIPVYLLGRGVARFITGSIAVFITIVAGDALLTDAFGIVAEAYVEVPEAAVRSILELSRAAGSQGMVGGQGIDLAAKTTNFDFEDLRLLHLLKTGALIRVASVGAAIVAGASEEQIEDLSDYASSLGLAFQVADDILDYSQERPESGSYCALLGPEKTRELLHELTDEALEAIIDWDDRAEPLRELAQFNLHRTR